MFSSRTQKYWYKYTNEHNNQYKDKCTTYKYKAKPDRAQVKLIIESQQHSCRTADEIFLDSRPLKASTSSVVYTFVSMYLSICESSRCISPLEAVQSINFPLKMCPRLAEKLFGPNLNPFFLQQLKRSVFLQHAVQTLCRISQYFTACRISQYFTACRISQYSTAQTLCVVFYSKRKRCCPSCLTWPKHWHTMDGG